MLPSEKINLYIAEHPEWQRKVLVRLRQIIHSECKGLEETWRSQGPHFDLAAQPLLNLTTSKTSVNVHFPKGAQFKSTRMPWEACAETKAGRTVKFAEGTAVQEAAFASLLHKAAALNLKQAKAGKEPECTDLECVLRKDPSAWANWEAFHPESRTEYEEWVSDGRNEETRKRRMAQAFEMIREGLTREEEEHRVKSS